MVGSWIRLQSNRPDSQHHADIMVTCQQMNIRAAIDQHADNVQQPQCTWSLVKTIAANEKTRLAPFPGEFEILVTWTGLLYAAGGDQGGNKGIGIGMHIGDKVQGAFRPSPRFLSNGLAHFLPVGRTVVLVFFYGTLLAQHPDLPLLRQSGLDPGSALVMREVFG